MNYLTIEELKNKLNCLVDDDTKNLCCGEILKTSQELDKHIVEFHKNAFRKELLNGIPKDFN